MYYKLTLLKDLPKYPAGTVFSYWKGQMIGICNSIVTGRFMCKYGKKHMKSDMPISEDLIYDSKWIRMEVDRTKLINIACPRCGDTHFDILKHAYKVGNPYDGYHYEADVYLECPCGYERHL